MCDTECQHILGLAALVVMILVFVVVLAYLFIQAYIAARKNKALETEREAQLAHYHGRRLYRKRQT